MKCKDVGCLKETREEIRTLVAASLFSEYSKCIEIAFVVDLFMSKMKLKKAQEVMEVKDEGNTEK